MSGTVLNGASFWLTRSVDERSGDLGDWRVARVEHKSNHLKVDYHFRQTAPAEELFDALLWTSLCHYLPDANAVQVLASRDYYISLPEAQLIGLRVHGGMAKDGQQRVLVTFRELYGSLRGVFRPGREPNLQMDSNCAIATRALSDLVVPILNLASLPPELLGKGLHEDFEAELRKLRDRKEELEFYSGLLSRYVSQSVTDHSADAEERILRRSRVEALMGLAPKPDVRLN
ncbi:hypothetical protein [Pacificoceanicola onchidii]|uniref:hypothetical protein n=1 Tax=Pacificoceanicola onchidii TaxID=2562685 RepID=UPI0010A5E5BD|nr:hypothetical protein [Pacificoceanicola onchidii]